MRALAVVVSVLTINCGHTSPGDHPADASSDGAPGSVQIACESHGTTFPLLEKSCQLAADCFIALHEVSCCGTEVAIGLNKGAQAAFTPAEMTCEAAYPGCGCASMPIMAEDGRTEAMGTIAVRCDTNQCRTYVP
jgi:hypothetical protein